MLQWDYDHEFQNHGLKCPYLYKYRLVLVGGLVKVVVNRDS